MIDKGEKTVYTSLFLLFLFSTRYAHETGKYYTTVAETAPSASHFLTSPTVEEKRAVARKNIRTFFQFVNASSTKTVTNHGI
jgi:hypothetical protein